MIALIRRIGRLILPEDVCLRKRRFELIVWAFLLSLSFDPEGLGFLAWFSLVRPFMIISSLKGRQAFNASYFFGFLFNLFCIYWISYVTPGGMIAAVAIVAVYSAISLTLFNKLYHIRPLYGIVAIPLLWVGVEYFRTLSEFAFPWSDLGYSQAYYLYILQIVSVVSVHGLSLLIVVVNVLLWQGLRRSLSPERRLASVFSAIAIVIGLLAYGWIELPARAIPGNIDIALLQPSVPLDVKWGDKAKAENFRVFDSLVQSVANDSIALYVWPETAAPCYLTHDPGCRRGVVDIVRKTKGLHLVGGIAAKTHGERYRYFNSCFQVDSAGSFAARHDKVKLVPFAEHVPYQDYLPFLEQGALREYLTFIDRWGIQWWSDYYPGDRRTLFQMPEATYAVLICFETAFPEYVRGAILDGADFVVGITNDTWWQQSPGIYTHSRIFISRAVENRCWFARCANSGLTYIVDPFGRIHERLETYEVAALRGKVRTLDGFSIFTRVGDLAGLISLLFTLAAASILLGRWVIRKVKPSVSSGN
ncbi:MAG: apolipoprotein N-acyltransferase [Candidatus Zixiibacteriota bacterium]